jgi:hypothetical protein
MSENMVPKSEPVLIGTYFDISQDVVKATKEFPIITRNEDNRTDLVCNECYQQIACLAIDSQPYIYTLNQLQSLLLSHLIQKHNWSREHARIS